jgi:hypothetical protein
VSGLLISIWWIWFIAAVPALTAERRELCSARIASIRWSFAAASARPDSVARAAS